MRKCRIVIIFIVALVLEFSCTNNKMKNSSRHPYSKIEIYCVCVESIPTDIGHVIESNCTSLDQKSPSKCVKPEYLYYSISDINVINSMKNMLLYSNPSSDTLIGGSNSGFVILLKRNEILADTFSLYGFNVFALNEKHKLKYSFNIEDSIRKTIGKDKIYCERK